MELDTETEDEQITASATDLIPEALDAHEAEEDMDEESMMNASVAQQAAAERTEREKREREKEEEESWEEVQEPFEERHRSREPAMSALQRLQTVRDLTFTTPRSLQANAYMPS